jgi:hypothetical protein
MKHLTFPNSDHLGALLALLCGCTTAFSQPVINSVYPPALRQRAGDHLAYVAQATGVGTLNYQWYFMPPSQPSAPLAGQTNSSLVLSNIQTTNAGTYWVSVVDNSGIYVSNFTTLNVAPYLVLAPTNVVVARVGDGAQVLSHATGNTLYLDQYTPSGTYVNTVMIPDTSVGAAYGTGSSASVFGSPALLIDGAGTDSGFEAMLTTSANQQYLGFAGFCINYPYSSTDVTSSGGNGGNRWRGMGTVNAFGFYNLAYTNTGLYSGGGHTIRSMVTSDGVTNFWTAGQAGSSGGIKYVNKTVTSYALGAGIPTITSSIANTRVVQIIGTNLVFSDWLGASGSGLYACSGTPTPAANAPNTASALILLEGGHPIDFAASPDLQTVYIADDQVFGGTNVQSGGIQRWDTTTPPTGYTYSYTLAPNAGGGGARGVVVDFGAHTTWGPGVVDAVIYATSADASTNTLSRAIDVGPSSTFAVLATAGTNQLLRGVRFGPSAATGVTIVTQPQSQTNFPGNTATFTVGAAGSAPFFYQWSFNGTNIAGATQSTLSVTNLQNGSAGNYAVTVSNLVPSSASSSNAVLTITAGAPTFALGVQSYVETAGDHLAFAPAVNGTLPISYQWFFANNPIPGETNANLVLTNIQVTNSGTYKLVATNIYGAASNSATLTVTATLQTLFATNLVVARIGDGVQGLSIVTGNTLYLDQYTSNGVYVSTIMVPDEDLGMPYGTGSTASTNLAPGSPALLVAGGGPDAGNAALLTRSLDGLTVNFAGYCLAWPYAGPDVTTGANGGTRWRGVAGVDAYGYYGMEYTNTGLYSGGNHTIRAGLTSDGTNIWTTGQAGANGLKYMSGVDMSYANGAGIPTITSTAAGTRMVAIVNGNLVFSDAGASPVGLYICDGAPQLANGQNALSSNLIDQGGAPVDFAFSPDAQTVYIADSGAFSGSNTNGGGIQRWDTNTISGGYTFSYTLFVGGSLNAGARGLTVVFPTNITTWGTGITGAILFATTAETNANRLVRIVDVGAPSTVTTLKTCGPNQVLSGVRFGPVPGPAVIGADPQPQTAFAGQTVLFTVGLSPRSGPYSYQWRFNGTNISSDVVLTLTNVTAANAGLYSVVVSNLQSSATSGDAQLTILDRPQFTSVVHLGFGVGFKLNYTGPLGVGYTIWTSSDLTLAPIQNTWTFVTSGSFTGGPETFTDANGGGNPAQFYIITVP